MRKALFIAAALVGSALIAGDAYAAKVCKSFKTSSYGSSNSGKTAAKIIPTQMWPVTVAANVGAAWTNWGIAKSKKTTCSKDFVGKYTCKVLANPCKNQ